MSLGQPTDRTDTHRFTGGEYDIVTFDPRGTGETLPFSCYNTTAERIAGRSLSPSVWTASDTALGYIWGAKQIQGARCLLEEPENGELIGTAFVARDIIKVVAALEEDGMVRFLGKSIHSRPRLIALDHGRLFSNELLLKMLLSFTLPVLNSKVRSETLAS